MTHLIRATLVAGLVVGGLAVAQGSRPAYAAFHCMRIHSVMAGYSSNNTIQYVELRMNSGFQTAVAGHVIQFYDGSNTLKATFTFPAGSLANGSVGDSILIGTSEFNSSTAGGDADYTFSMANTVGANGGDPLHPVQGSSGRVHFAPGADTCDTGVTISAGEVDSVAYGTATAHWGSAATALASPADRTSLRLDNLDIETATFDNSADYSLVTTSTTTFAVAPGSLASNLATPRNNGRIVLQLPQPAAAGAIAEEAMPADPDALTQDRDSAADAWVYIAGATLLALAAGGGGLVLMRRTR